MIARQFLVYIVVGIVSALIDVGLMQFLISADIYHLTAATFGFFVGLVVNFSLHARVTFKKDFSCIVFARYIAVVLVNCALTLVMVKIFHDWLSMPILGKIASLPLVLAVGFFLSKYWIYRPHIIRER